MDDPAIILLDIYCKKLLVVSDDLISIKACGDGYEKQKMIVLHIASLHRKIQRRMYILLEDHKNREYVRAKMKILMFAHINTYKDNFIK